MDVEQATAAGEVNLANALDLSESEEEEELEDLIEDFALQTDLDQVRLGHELYMLFINHFARIQVSDKRDCTSSSSQHHSQHSFRKHHPRLMCL